MSEGSIVAIRSASRSLARSRPEVPSADRLQGLSGSPLADRFRTWRGRSGRRYIFSVFPIASDMSFEVIPDLSDAVLLAAAVEADGRRRILWIGQTGSCPELVTRGQAVADARSRGATELHIHLLTADARGRRAVVADLG